MKLLEVLDTHTARHLFRWSHLKSVRQQISPGRDVIQIEKKKKIKKPQTWPGCSSIETFSKKLL